MTVKHSTVATVLVAIDISKHRHEVLISIPGKTRRRRMTVMNTGQLPSDAGASSRPARVRTEAGFLGWSGPNARSPAQQLGQERPQGCPGHPPHAGDRCRAVLP